MTGVSGNWTSSRLASALVAVAWLATIVLIAAWLLGTSTGTLREQLKVWQFWSLEVCVLLAALVGVGLIRELSRDLGRSDVARMAMLVVVAVGLTVFVAPRTNRIFYDEQIYQGIGQNLADLRLAQMCNDGNVEYGRLRCASGEYNKQPYAYPHLLSLAYRFFGVHEGAAFALNAAAMAATAVGVYLLVWVLFRDRDAALFAGLLLSLTPMQLVWSATAAVEPTASLAVVAALLCAAHYARTGSHLGMGATAVAAAYGMQFRPESVLMLPAITVLIWPRLRRDLRHPRGWWAGLTFLALVATHVAHLYAIRNVGWGTAAARFSLDYVEPNLRVNGWFYFFDERFPLAFSLLALLGLWSPEFRREKVSMAAYFLLFFAVGLVFYAGSYNFGADVRYSLMTYPPIAVLGGLGAARLARLIGTVGDSVPAMGLVAAVLALQFSWYAPVVRATTEEAWAARADVRVARSFAAELPSNSYVLTHNPSMFHQWGVNAGQMSHVVSNPSYISLLASRYAGGVYVHWNFWCNVQDPIQQEFCRTAIGMGPVDIVREYRERDQRFALYRMTALP